MLREDEIELLKPWSGGGEYAVSRRHRRRGLTGKERTDVDAALIFEKCRSIHTFGMKFSLVVVFVDADFVVLKKQVVPPRRIVFGPRGTHAIIELPFD